jgi:hypothetical protein
MYKSDKTKNTKQNFLVTVPVVKLDMRIVKPRILSRFCALLLALALSLSLAACGGGDAQNDTADPPTPSYVPEETPEQEPESGAAEDGGAAAAGPVTTYTVGNGFTIDVPDDAGLNTEEFMFGDSTSRFVYLLDDEEETVWALSFDNKFNEEGGYDKAMSNRQSYVKPDDSGTISCDEIEFFGHNGFIYHNIEAGVRSTDFSVDFPYVEKSAPDIPFASISFHYPEGDAWTLLEDPIVKRIIESMNIIYTE